MALLPCIVLARSLQTSSGTFKARRPVLKVLKALGSLDMIRGPEAELQ